MVEVGVKRFSAGDKELAHFQLTAHEITIVIEGEIRLGKELFQKDDVVLIPPLEVADFESISDAVLVCIKYPSSPSDKVIL